MTTEYQHAGCRCCVDAKARFIDIDETEFKKIQTTNTYWTKDIMVSYFCLLEHVVLQHKGGTAIDCSFLMDSPSSGNEMGNGSTQRLEAAPTILIPLFLEEPTTTEGHYVLFELKKDESKIVVYDSQNDKTDPNDFESAIRNAAKK